MAGRYYITRLAGKGPAGELFVALDATDKSGKVTEFHLHRYKKEFCVNEAFVQALANEATVELGLSHPNLLRLHDFGTWDGLCFLVYERYPSLSLREALAALKEAGRVADPIQVSAATLQLLDALIYAHGISEASGGRKPPVFQAGFSPECVDLSSGGQLKVRGFTRAGAGPRPSFLDMALGRMPYLASEIWDGGQPSARTDLFSLGALVYELLTGEALPEGGSSGFPAAVPRELAGFAGKLLGKGGAFSSAADAKAGLEKVLFTLGMKAGPGDLAGWHRSLLKLNPRLGLKEARDEGQREVLAEVVANRKLLPFETAMAEAGAKALEKAEASIANIPSPVPAPAPARADPKAGAWEGSTTFKEAPNTEAEDRSAARAKKARVMVLAGAAVATLAIAGAGAWLYATRPPPPKTQGELLAAFAADSGGVLTVQGVRNDADKKFGPAGLRFRCEYLLAPDDTEHAERADGEYSERYNFVQCPPPPGGQKFVRIASNEEKPKRSNSVPVRGALTWRNVLGPDLQKTRVNWIYRFTCDRSFVEGEGVLRDGRVVCPGSQKLNLLHAIYHYYSKWSEETKETPEPVPVATESVCGLASYSAWRCLDGSKVMLFGLYKKEEPPFTVPVSLMRSPVGENTVSPMGYAAEPDANGLCPVGLQKVKQWNAVPPTIGPAGASEDPARKEPDEKREGEFFSTFRNDSGELNNRLIESQQPKPFLIMRQKNRAPCDGKGSCAFATFEDPEPAYTMGYTQAGEFCVLPPSLERAAVGDDARVPGYGAVEKAGVVTVRVKTRLVDYEVYVNGRKAEVSNHVFQAPIHQELTLEVKKQGFKRTKVTLPPFERAEDYLLEAPAVEVQMGEVDIGTFPPSDCTITFLGPEGEEVVFKGQTPVKEQLPVGEYMVRFQNAKINADQSTTIKVQAGRTTSVDQLLKSK